MNPDPLIDVALQAFERVVGNTPGFRLREGQLAMASQVAHSLAAADLGDAPNPHQSIAIIQAGTGVGKSAAYASTAIAMALERKTRVLISTATVALQEQLIHKDLPALAATLEQTFSFALAKGRSRYVCKLKLDRLVGGTGIEGWEDDLFEGNEGDSVGSYAIAPNTTTLAALQERRSRVYEHMAHLVAGGKWNGDRDTLAEAPDAADWSAVAAERHSCTARHCPRYKDCSYYNARSALAQANVIVANHDLVLASLGMKMLPELDNCLVIFDEAHHLPAIALNQFCSTMDLSNLRWLDRLPKAMIDVSGKLGLHLAEDVNTVCSQLKAALTQLARLTLDLVHPSGTIPVADVGKRQETNLRFAHGALHDALFEPLQQIQLQALGIFGSLEALGTEVKAIAKEDPSQATLCAQLYALLGPLSPRLGSVVATANMLLEQGGQPLAKWLSVTTEGAWINVYAHASPIVPGDLLRQQLWGGVRAAVLTSASLTSCSSFDWFLDEAGLSDNPCVTTLEVSSPFDYATQGGLTIVQTRSEPRDVASYTREMVQALMQDLLQVRSGALVLFTSRAQMRAATDALPAALLECTQVQGSQSRTRLLASHTARVEAGLPSIIFGLQSFGEGLDLPGKLCETVFIAKLPFASPTDPVAEARSEWLQSSGRDPFNELVVPATGIRLLQWTGRAIRTEEDRAQVICYDKRLNTTPWGRRMLDGLPPWQRTVRKL